MKTATSAPVAPAPLRRRRSIKPAATEIVIRESTPISVRTPGLAITQRRIGWVTVIRYED